MINGFLERALLWVGGEDSCHMWSSGGIFRLVVDCEDAMSADY